MTFNTPNACFSVVSEQSLVHRSLEVLFHAVMSIQVCLTPNPPLGLIYAITSKALSFEAYFTLKAAKDSLNLGLNLH